MKIEYKLNDPNICEGCICNYDEYQCSLGYWTGGMVVRKNFHTADGKIIRPEQCKEDLGE